MTCHARQLHHTDSLGSISGVVMREKKHNQLSKVQKMKRRISSSFGRLSKFVYHWKWNALHDLYHAPIRYTWRLSLCLTAKAGFPGVHADAALYCLHYPSSSPSPRTGHHTHFVVVSNPIVAVSGTRSCSCAISVCLWCLQNSKIMDLGIWSNISTPGSWLMISLLISIQFQLYRSTGRALDVNENMRIYHASEKTTVWGI